MSVPLCCRFCKFNEPEQAVGDTCGCERDGHDLEDPLLPCRQGDKYQAVVDAARAYVKTCKVKFQNTCVAVARQRRQRLQALFDAVDELDKEVTP